MSYNFFASVEDIIIYREQETMKNNLIGISCIVFVIFISTSTPLFAQTSSLLDENVTKPALTFFQRLDAQEEREHKELTDKVRRMSDTEHRAFVLERIRKSYSQDPIALSAFVIIEVTDEMNEVEKNAYSGPLAATPKENLIGIDRLKRSLVRTQNSDTRLHLKQKFTNGSTEQERHFQWIEGQFNKGSAIALINEAEITDLHIYADQEHPVWSSVVAFDTETGRILPPKERKNYSEDFIRAGMYEDVMKSFENSETAFVSVNFINYQSDTTPTPEWEQAREQAVDDFLLEWSDYEFDIIRKRLNYINFRTTKEHVEAMNEHDFVDKIWTANGLHIAIHDDLP